MFCNKPTGSSVLVSWLAPGLVATVSLRSPLRAPDPGAPRMLTGKECAVIPVGRTLDAGARCVSGRCPDCQAALGLSARRRSADLQRSDRPGSSVVSWTTSPAAIQMYTNERISDLEARWSRCSCCISSGVTMLPNPPGAALDAVVPEGASPVREPLFNAGYVKRWGPPRSRSTGLPCHGLMSGEYSEGEARPGIGSHHWWGFAEPVGAAKGQRT